MKAVVNAPKLSTKKRYFGFSVSCVLILLIEKTSIADLLSMQAVKYTRLERL